MLSPQIGRRPAAPLLLLLSTGMFLSACTRKSVEVSGAQAALPSAASPAESATPSATPAGKEDTESPSGLDLGKLDELERKIFFRIVNHEASACGKGHSLIFSVKNDRGCRKSHYAIRYVLRLVSGGFTDSEVEKALEERYRKVEIKTIDIAGSPTKGNPNAAVKLVEFVDYECPHCRLIQPVFKQIVEEFKTDVSVTLKHYPLGQHTNARLAAAAGVAAHKQGKFWALSDKVWENADSITKSKLEQLAAEVGLDLERFRKDLDDPASADAVQKDKDEGGRLGIRSTPTIYINGQLYTDGRDAESLRDWILEALGR